MRENTIKFAVIGCGHIGKRHAEMVMRNNQAELVALIDVQPKEQLGIDAYPVPFYPSLDAYLATNPEVDVITIATPNGYHAEQAIACLQAGKHIVVEKPIALNKKDAEQIIHTALKVNKQVFAVMQNRYSPPSVWLKDVLDAGLLGTIYMVQLNCFWNRDARYYNGHPWHGSKHLDGGTLYTQFSHFIDIMFWLFGDISNIQARFKDFNHQHLTDFEDSGIISFEFLNGGMGSLNYSTSVWDTNLESSLTVIAEHGSIKVGGQYMDKVEYCHIKDYQMPTLQPTNPGNDYGAYKGSAQNHNYVIENVVNTLSNTDIITTNVFEGLKVVEIIDSIYERANKSMTWSH